MDVHINIKKRHAYLITAVILLFAGIIMVKGYGGSSPSIFGHTANELDIDPKLDGQRTLLGNWLRSDVCQKDGTNCFPISTGRINDQETVNPPSGYTLPQCAILVSMEDDHYGPAYSSTFSDSGWWGDNIYAGSQAFYDQSTGKVTCRYGFNTYSGPDPTWHGAQCRYLMICKK